MDIAKVKTCVTFGLAGYEVIIEADQTSALPGIEIIGLPDTSIKEARERIRAVFKHVGISFPPRKIILNLAPSDLKKTGTSFDFPLAVAIYMLLQPFRPEIADICREGIFLGELGLDGKLKSVSGILPAVISATKLGYKHFFVSDENAAEISIIPDIFIHPFTSFLQFVQVVQGLSTLQTIDGSNTDVSMFYSNYTNNLQTNISDIIGHAKIKRSLVIAAAGSHNCILNGPPGTGKTMLAQSIGSILPPLSFEQSLEISQIYSVAGKLTSKQPLIRERPCRQVHHTASKVSIIGGGQNLLPGEISLAHYGVLLLDELPEFRRDVLEVLRQPLEEGYVTISRAQGTVQYPAKCLFIGTMNPCPCGFYRDSEHACICTTHEIKRYQARISGPLRDRCDMLLEVPRQSVDVLIDSFSGDSKSTAEDDLQKYRQIVEEAYEIQHKRYVNIGISANAYLRSRDLPVYINCEEKAEGLLKAAAKRIHFSARVTHKILKVARTIADIEKVKYVQIHHMAEALQYRAKHFFIEQ